MAKRLFDLAAGAGLILLLLPLMAAIAAVLAVRDGLPVLFRQERCGVGGKVFVLLKFRSMRGEDGPLVTAAGDPRITAFGRILRRTKLDELPQLFNVLRGDMSLVGPRPEVPGYVADWPDADRELVLSVRPGLTDPATLMFFNEEDILDKSEDPAETYLSSVLPRKLALYRAYVLDHSFAGDLRLLAQTALLVLRRIAGMAGR